MTQSMTGYAREETQTQWGRVSWELRSVNHRFLDVHLRMPEELRALESDIRSRIGARLRRGKVDAGLRVEFDADPSGQALSLDLQRLDQLAEACRTVEQRLDQTRPADPIAVLGWPGVVQRPALDVDALGDAVLALLGQALDELSAGREREGERLAQLLRERGEAIRDLVQQVRARLPQVREQWRSRLEARLAELGDKVEVDSSRLEQELLMLAQRADVDEELDRLESHVDELHQALKRRDAIGRRLDFLLQEFNREANTLSSKSQDSEVTALAVEMKVTIEQMREQAQNVE